MVTTVLLLLGVSPRARADNLIQRPGAHNHYFLELEPHFYVRYGRWANGVGPGFRASVPLMHNGPIQTLNNNIAITFGVDVPFVLGHAQIDIPVAGQWNFHFTDVISAFGEAGLSMSFWTGPGRTFALDPLFLAGARFQFGIFGFVVRAGYPALTAGVNFQF